MEIGANDSSFSEPIANILYLSDTCEPTALLQSHSLLKPPLPILYLSFLRSVLTTCPVFAYAVGGYHFVIGFSRSQPYMFDLRSTFLRNHLDSDMITEVPVQDLPLYYNKTDKAIEVYKSSSNGSTRPIITLDLPDHTVHIESVLLDNMLISFLAKRSCPTQLIVLFKKNISPTRSINLSFSIELSSAPVYAAASLQHFVAVDRTGTLILGNIADLLQDLQPIENGDKPTNIPLNSLSVKHLWSDPTDQAFFNGDIPTCCAVSSELGVVVVSSTSGRLGIYDVGLNPIVISDNTTILDLKRLLSITPNVFRILFIDTQLVLIFERAPPLFLQLSNNLNQHTLFLKHLFSEQPNRALSFTVRDISILLIALHKCASQLKNQKPKAIPPRDSGENLNVLVGIWKNTMGADALSIFTDGLEDLISQRIDLLKCKLISMFKYMDDINVMEFLSSTSDDIRPSVALLRAAEFTASLLMQTDQAESMVQLGLHLKESKLSATAEVGDLILHNAYYYCMQRGYTDIAAVISHSLQYNILEARPYPGYLRLKTVHGNEVLREVESSTFYLLVERFLNGDFTDIADNLKDLKLEEIFSISDLTILVRSIDSDLLFADQSIVS